MGKGSVGTIVCDFRRQMVVLKNRCMGIFCLLTGWSTHGRCCSSSVQKWWSKSACQYACHSANLFCYLFFSFTYQSDIRKHLPLHRPLTGLVRSMFAFIVAVVLNCHSSNAVSHACEPSLSLMIPDLLDSLMRL